MSTGFCKKYNFCIFPRKVLHKSDGGCLTFPRRCAILNILPQWQRRCAPWRRTSVGKK
nr:MAG TPA: hypothetical protein [Caudoviricetes sp.]